MNRGEVQEPKGEQTPNPSDLKTTGARIAWLRSQYGLSLQDFGRRIGYDGSQISRIERGRCHVVDRFIRVVCIQFRVPESWLREGLGTPVLEGALSGADMVDTPAAVPVEPAITIAPVAVPVVPVPLPAPVREETLTISSQEWREAWMDLRSYVEVLDKLSAMGRSELAGKLHRLVDRVCSPDDADGMITISTRLREDDGEAAPSTLDAEVTPAPKARAKPRAEKGGKAGDDGWKVPGFPVQA
jgi:transcriptional regulator with XRE-family HTH domain